MTTPPPQPDEFYVGYLARAPGGIARFVRRSVLGLLIVGLGSAVVASTAQRPFDAATFEFGNQRTFEGRVTMAPYPSLVVARPGTAGHGVGPVSRYHLVAPGKHGADAMVDPLVDYMATLEGSLVYRDDQTMIEVVPGSLARRPEAGMSANADSAERLGRVTLKGEIVDAKCFLGVMNPGSWTPHRACAVRCLSGGIPPMLVVRDSLGVAAYVLLATSDGRPAGAALLDLVAEPVEVTGRLERRLGQLMLFADRSGYRPL